MARPLRLLLPHLTLFLLACGGGDPSGNGSFDESACPFKLHPSQQLGQTARCGVLHVPENRDKPGGALITVPVLLFKAGQSGLSPLVNLSGGPGQSWGDLGVDTVRADLSATLTRDLILIEQRGTGLSRPSLACPETDAPLNQMVNEEVALMACRDRLQREGRDLTGYHTRALAADVEDLRQALGYERLVLSGTSYGTLWGLTVLRQSPGSVLALILDSVLTPQQPALRGLASARDGAFTALFRACLSDRACSAAYPALEAQVDRALAALQQRPRAWKDGPGGPNGKIDGAAYFDVLEELLFAAPALAPLFVHQVSKALDADAAGVDPLDARITQALAASAQGTGSLAYGQYLSVTCSDNQGVTDAEVDADLQKARPAYRPYLQAAVQGLRKLCQSWPVAAPPAGTFTPVSSGVPTLLLSGGLDPRTPPAYAREAARTLSRGVVAEFPGLSHSVQSAAADPLVQRCISRLVQQILAAANTANAPTPLPIDTSCADVAGAAFVTP